MELNQVQIEQTPLHECELVCTSSDNSLRVYVKRNKPVALSDQTGFRAVILEFVSACARTKEKEDGWDEPEVMIDIVADITAFFDGPRHVQIAPASNGYLNYPNTVALLQCLEAIKKVEEKYCIRD